MRVLTWNLWWRFGPWEERQPAIAAELASVDADLVFLQEVWASDDVDQAHELGGQFGYHVARSVRADGRRHEFGNAILSRWPIAHHETLILPGPDGTPGHRSAVVAQVDSPAGELWLLCTHLDWRYDGSLTRQAQLEHIMAWVRPMIGEPADMNYPLILAGDFNAVAESDEIRRLTGLAPPYEPGLVFTDAWAAVGDGPGYTWTRDNQHSPDAQWPRRRLDYVMTSWPRPKPTGNPVSARVAGLEAHDGVVPSDHSAVVVELDERRPPEEATNA